MLFFKIIWVFDALAALIIFYFFFVGIADGTVSSRNAGLWMMIVGGLSAILLGSMWLKNHSYTVPAIMVLFIIAVPAFFFLLYMLIALCGNGRWN